MATCQYIADSAPRVLRDEHPASTSTTRARVLGVSVPPSSATSFTIAA